MAGASISCVRLCFTKSQGQTLKQVGIYLAEDVFAHGQLYVADTRDNIRFALKNFLRSTVTKNIVYSGVIH